MIKKIVSVILIFILLSIMTVPSFAASISELKDQKQEAEDKKDEVTAEKNSVLDDISELNAQISDYEDDIDELQTKISDLKDSIETKEKEIKELEEENKEREKLLVNRLIAMYEKGQTTYLDILLSSDDITSFISGYYRVEEIAQADQEVITSILEKQEETQEVKDDLEKEKKEVDEAKKEVESKNEKLQVAKKAKQAKVNNLSAEEKELQQTIDEFEEAIKDAQKEIEEAGNNASSGGGYEGSFEGVLDWPLSYSYNIITSVFGYRDSPTAGASSNHGAVDIAVSYVPVYAPASGKVIIARWLSGYGNYVMIDHGNGYYTGFGHLSGYSVSQGQTVSRGQQIATSGNTGISTGPHLHYEVYIGGTANSYRVDPLQYTSHPSLVYY
jgi:murein DD-endopeptidase MepM/ murein hydrolase activator NlpD